MAKPKRSVGRPTKYKPEFAEDLINYFNVDGPTVENEKIVVPVFPTLSRFALNLRVHTDTLYEWAHAKTTDSKDKETLKHPEFSVAYRMAKLYQEAYLYENGIAGTIDRTFGMWATKTILGHREPEKEISNDASSISEALKELADKLPT